MKDDLDAEDVYAGLAMETARRVLTDMSWERLVKYAEVGENQVLSFPRAIAKMAWEISDAMLAEKAKRAKGGE